MSESDKIQAILDGVQDIKLEIARIGVKQDQHRKEIDKLNKEVEDLKGNQNKAIGFLTLIGICATAIFTWIFKHF